MQWSLPATTQESKSHNGDPRNVSRSLFFSSLYQFLFPSKNFFPSCPSLRNNVSHTHNPQRLFFFLL